MVCSRPSCLLAALRRRTEEAGGSCLCTADFQHGAMTEETMRLLEELIACCDSDLGKDTMCVPLLDHDRVQQTWENSNNTSRCQESINIFCNILA